MLLRRQVIAAGILVPLWGCLPSQRSIRVKLAYMIVTDGRRRTTSSVIELFSARQPIKLPEGAALDTEIVGEATAIPLKGGVVFATLEVPGPAHTLPVAIVSALLGPVSGPDDFFDKLGRLSSGSFIGKTAALNRENYPQFVHFERLLDPASVVAEDPDGLSDGSRVVGISCTITTEPVTTQLMNYIPWAYAQKDTPLNPRHSSSDWSLSATMNGYAFIRGR